MAAVVALAALAHAVSLLAARAINLDGSHSSLAPATHPQVALDLAVYAVATVALIATYVAIVVLAARDRIHGLGRVVALSAPIAIQVVLLYQRPWLSTDVLSYVAQGSVGVAFGNPYLGAPHDVLGTAVGEQLLALGWKPQAIVSPYGPLWTAYEVGVMSLTQNVGVAAILMKLPAFLASLGSTLLVWKILGEVRPQLRLTGTLVFLWSPVAIAELAGEGHVDGVMVFLVLLGIWSTLRVRPMASAAVGSLAVLTKYLPLVLLPAQLAYVWQGSRHDPRGRARRLLVAGGVGVGIAALLFEPFWAGARTLDGLRIMGQPGPWPTVTGIVYRYVERWWPGIDAGAIATILVSGGFAVFVIRSAFAVRGARSLLATLAATALIFVLVASPVFYPWYAVLPIALVALVPETPYLLLIVALTAMSRLVAPLVDLRPAYEPVPGGAYTLTLVGLCVCIGIGIVLVLRATWAWAAAGDRGAPEESAAAAG